MWKKKKSDFQAQFGVYVCVCVCVGGGGGGGEWRLGIY